MKNNLSDSFYLESRPKEPKEIFKFIQENILKLSIKCNAWLDIGCGIGSFCEYLINTNNYSIVNGLDISSAHIRQAKDFFQNDHEFICADFTKNLETELFSCSHDVISLVGVTGRFPTVKEYIPPLVNFASPNKPIYIICDLFNPLPVDITVSAKNSSESNFSPTYFNLQSVHSLNALAKQYNYRMHSYKFTMPFDLPISSDPFRSWTVKVDNERMLTNGLCQLYNIYCCILMPQ